MGTGETIAPELDAVLVVLRAAALTDFTECRAMIFRPVPVVSGWL
ncbi:hypothetical protein [Bifidobacterium santillanense]|nr:hypothetical protein [Bifidobacterium santillanense]